MAKRIRLLWVGLVVAATAAAVFGTPAVVAWIPLGEPAGGPYFSPLELVP